MGVLFATVMAMALAWSVLPSGVNWKDDGVADKPVPPFGVNGKASGGACSAVAAAHVVGAGLSANMVMVTPVVAMVTHTVRRWAMAVFCPKRRRADVSSWNPRPLKEFESMSLGAIKTANTPRITTTMISSIKVNPSCFPKRPHSVRVVGQVERSGNREDMAQCYIFNSCLVNKNGGCVTILQVHLF